MDIETDSQKSVQAMNATEEVNYLEVGMIFKECHRRLIDRRDFSISFVKKQANKVAHFVAREPCAINCFIEFHAPPQSVLEFLVRDNLLI